jgi:hypothetical protein
MQLVCPSCKANITLRQKYFYHAGFSNQGFLYCDNCSTILEFSVYNPNYVRLAGEKHPWSLSRDEQAFVEHHLAPCSTCGGRFRFNAVPGCPNCSADISILLPSKLHFIELGKIVDGDKEKDIWV